MAVECVWSTMATVKETISVNTGAMTPSDLNRQLVFDAYDHNGRMDATTTPAATKFAKFLLTLSTGAATIDLSSLTGTNGALINGTGLKVQLIMIKNLGAALMTFAEGGSNGYAIGSSLVVHPSGVGFIYAPEVLPDIASGAKTIDVTGTGSQTAEITIVMG